MTESEGSRIRESLVQLNKIADVLDGIPGLIDVGEVAMGYSLLGRSYADINKEVENIRYEIDVNVEE